jgi:uncharacterized protein YprB with RNaseH-like and TPR domain
MVHTLPRPKAAKRIPIPAVDREKQPLELPDAETDLIQDLQRYWAEQRQATGLAQVDRIGRDVRASKEIDGKTADS